MLVVHRQTIGEVKINEDCNLFIVASPTSDTAVSGVRVGQWF